MTQTWPAGLVESSCIRLTTFRRDGRAVPTPVWFAEQDGVLWAFTGRTAGKVKRMRHTPRVLVCASDQRGRPTGPEVEATVALHEGPVGHAARARVGRRHRLAFPLFAIAFRLRRREDYDNPVGIEIRRAPGGSAAGGA